MHATASHPRFWGFAAYFGGPHWKFVMPRARRARRARASLTWPHSGTHRPHPTARPGPAATPNAVRAALGMLNNALTPSRTEHSCRVLWRGVAGPAGPAGRVVESGPSQSEACDVFADTKQV